MLALFAAASWLPAALHGIPAASGQEPALPTVAAATASATATPSAAPQAPAPPPPDIGRPALPLPRDIPAQAHGPVAAVRDYLFTLECAAVPPEGMGAIGCGETAFPRAYAYLDAGWRSRMPFAKFVAGFSGVLHSDLLLALDAGPVAGSPNERRVFAEVRRIEVLAGRQAVTYAAGVFTVASERTGWFLIGGALQPEDLAGLAYLGQDVQRADPLAVARTAAGLRPDGPAPAALQPHTGPAAVVRIRLPAGTDVVHMVQRVDGVWQVLYIEKA